MAEDWGSWGTACAPVSTSGSDYLTADGQERTAFVSHRLLTRGDPLTLCSIEEVEIVETAYFTTFDKSGHDAAQAEAERIARALIRGEKLPRPANPRGCSTG